MGKAPSKEGQGLGAGAGGGAAGVRQTLPKMRPRTSSGGGGGQLAARHNSMIAASSSMAAGTSSALHSRAGQPAAEDACFPQRPQSMLMFDADPWESAALALPPPPPAFADPAGEDTTQGYLRDAGGPNASGALDDMGLDDWASTLTSMANADWDAQLQTVAAGLVKPGGARQRPGSTSLPVAPADVMEVRGDRGGTHRVPMRRDSKRRSQRAASRVAVRVSERGFGHVPRPKSIYNAAKGRSNPWMAVPDKRPAKPNLIALNRLDKPSRQQGWFRLKRDKEESIALLENHKAHLAEGTFVLHASGSGFAALCLVHRGELYHEHMVDTRKGLHLVSRPKKHFATIGELVAFFASGRQKGLPCRLKPDGLAALLAAEAIAAGERSGGPIYDQASQQHGSGHEGPVYDVARDTGYSWLDTEEGLYDLGTEQYLAVEVTYDAASGYLHTEAIYDTARRSGYLETVPADEPGRGGGAYSEEGVYDPRTLGAFRYEDLSDSEGSVEHEYAVPLDLSAEPSEAGSQIDLSPRVTGLRTPHGSARRSKSAKAKKNGKYTFPAEDPDQAFQDSVLLDSDDEEFGFGRPPPKEGYQYNERGYLVPMDISDKLEGFITHSNEFFDESSRVCGTAFTPCQSDQWFFVGLSCPETNYHGGRDCHFDDINFAIFCMGTGKATAREGEDEVGPYVPYQAGDQFQVRIGLRKGRRRVEYVRNNKIFYASTAKPRWPLYAEQAFHPLNGGETLVKAVKWIFMP